MTAFDEQHSVWTEFDDERWRERNGTSELVLVGSLSLGSARFLCERLLMTQPTGRFWVKDINNQVVAEFSNRPPLQSSARPKRRTLGTRS